MRCVILPRAPSFQAIKISKNAIPDQILRCFWGVASRKKRFRQFGKTRAVLNASDMEIHGSMVASEAKALRSDNRRKVVDMREHVRDGRHFNTDLDDAVVDGLHIVTA